MIRRLFIVFASGLLLSIILLSSAWVLGGTQLIDQIDKEGGFAFTIDDDGNGAPKATKDLAFDPAVPLVVALPATVRFTRGDTAHLTVTGPRNLIDALQWQDGRLSGGHHVSINGSGIRITITAPALPKLKLDAPADVELSGLDQPALDITAKGAVDLDASGKVGKITVTSAGAGNLDLEGVEAMDATVRIEGVGNVDIKATGTVDARIEGAGNISLHAKPKVLTSRIEGIGNIDHDY